MLWFAYVVDLDELGSQAADRLAAAAPGYVRELFEELVNELGEPVEDEGVEGGILDDVLSCQPEIDETMRPGLPEPFLGKAERGYRSEIGYLEASEVSARRARLQPDLLPGGSDDAEEYALSAYSDWLAQADAAGRSLVFLWE